MHTYLCLMVLRCSGPHALSLSGDIYCCSTAEMMEFSVSARRVASGCSVMLKEGMRPSPVVDEETVTVEAGKDEKEAGKAEEIPEAGKAISVEQPVYVSVL